MWPTSDRLNPLIVYLADVIPASSPATNKAGSMICYPWPETSGHHVMALLTLSWERIGWKILAKIFKSQYSYRRAVEIRLSFGKPDRDLMLNVHSRS
ncbi:hypothetical protein AJ88_28515 [Mesorhizobium amorphae CCBAU 01583]|nr:hypothetical protein AJ88_28515 [Mesorhizobium amorphae CCBAU 01583]